MNFGTAIKTGFKKYADFTGVASRSEYWYWMLFTWLVSTTFNIVGSGMARVMNQTNSSTGMAIDPLGSSSMLGGLWALAVFLPTLAVGVRRLRDAGVNPKLMWLAVSPFGVVLGILMLIPGVSGLSPQALGVILIFGLEFLGMQNAGALFPLVAFVFLFFAALLAIGILLLVWLCRPSLSAAAGNRFLASVQLAEGAAPEQSSVPNNLEI